MCLGLLLDLGTRSNFFILFINSFYFYYKKALPDCKIELSFGVITYFVILYNFDRRWLAGICFFLVSTWLKFLGRTESAVIASVFSITLLNFYILPDELRTYLVLFLGLFFVTDPSDSVVTISQRFLLCSALTLIPPIRSPGVLPSQQQGSLLCYSTTLTTLYTGR